MQGVYIHIPFCRQACTYCDFHFSTQLNTKAAMVDAICREIELRKDYLRSPTIDTIYFGGGTPSLLTEAELNRILDTLMRVYTWQRTAEITLECNPDDLTPEKLRALHGAGVNRLSIGLQSFNDQELRWMNRAHTAAQSEQCIKAAQDHGFDNITIDLMYGSRFQTLKTWEETLLKALSLGVQHISAYNLTVEAKTALGNAVKKGTEPQVDDEQSAAQFTLMTDLLENNGFIHYEISNFGKKGYFAVHNTNYWKGCHYLGLGPSAHSYNGLARQWNVANNHAYINAVNNPQTAGPHFETEVLTPSAAYNEYVLTGLRTIWGCDIGHIEKNFGKSFAEQFVKGAKAYMPEHVTENQSVYTLTRKGRLLADKIAMELFV